MSATPSATREISSDQDGYLAPTYRIMRSITDLVRSASGWVSFKRCDWSPPTPPRSRLAMSRSAIPFLPPSPRKLESAIDYHQMEVDPPYWSPYAIIPVVFIYIFLTKRAEEKGTAAISCTMAGGGATTRSHFANPEMRYCICLYRNTSKRRPRPNPRRGG